MHDRKTAALYIILKYIKNMHNNLYNTETVGGLTKYTQFNFSINL